MTNDWNDECRRNDETKESKSKRKIDLFFGMLASIIPSCFFIRISSLLLAFVSGFCCNAETMRA
jgi:hypothetical protein